MAVVQIVEDLGSRTCDLKLALPPGRYDRTYQRVYKIFTDSDFDEGPTVYNASTVAFGALPLIGVAYPGDPGSILVSKKLDRLNDNPRAWKLTCDWQSHFDFDPATLNENPLLRPPIYTIGYQQGERAVREDLDDVPITNSATTPFLPPLSLSYGQPTFEVTWNSATLTPVDLLDNQDVCNEDTWNGLPATSVLLKGISYQEKFENNIVYWEKKASLVGRSLDIEPLGWEYVNLLDQGFYELIKTPTPPVRKLIRDAHGAPLPEPSLLDGNGKKLASGADPVYLGFRMRRKVPFTGLIPTL